MTATITRLKKEARAIFWPWSAVVVAGVLPLLLPYSAVKKFSALSFFLGIPLLASLSLGNEFHHRTISFWLTQPCSRMRLWGEKMIVMCAAVLSAALVSGTMVFTFTIPGLAFPIKLAAAAYVILIMASATYCTLAARSTIGGLVLISCIFYTFYLFVAVLHLPNSAAWSQGTSLPAATLSAIALLGICFASLLLWLGARKLERLEATGATSGEDLLMTTPSIMPEALADWFRCRPAQPVRNLIRKEFRLLHPIWLIEAMVVLYLTLLAVLRLLPFPPALIPRTPLQWALVGPVGAVCLGLAGLAGILSLGEERSSGTHAWQMTLPISARLQWLIKLAMALLSGLACAVLLPVLTMIAVGSAYGSPLMFVFRPALPDWLTMYPLLTFACFWCACAANGTVRAVTWVFPGTAAIFFASSGGMWLGKELAQTTGTVRDLVLSWLHLSPLAFASVIDSARAGVLWLFVPTLLLALVQTYRLFRAQPQDGAVWMLRCLAPLAAVTFLWSFSCSVGFSSSRWEPFSETRQALDKFQPGTAKLELTGEDLAKGASLSSLTRRWLRGASISVAPEHSRLAGYVATIHVAGGLECRMSVTHYGGAAVSCGDKARRE